jgi:Xaa-Pro aminopeptidase
MSRTETQLDYLRAQMVDAHIDLVAVGPTTNMRYLLGFSPHPDERLCLLLVTASSAGIVVPALNADQLAEHTDLPLFRWADEDGPDAALRDALLAAGHGGRLAVDGTTRADFILPLLEQVKVGGVLSAGSLFTPLRQRKSAEEIELLAAAAVQADRAMAAGAAACRPGASEADVAWAIEAAFRQDGAETVDFALVASGPNGAFPHHHAGPRRLQVGDAIVLDIGATRQGYKSDITRMVCLGQPGEEVRRAYAAVLAANERGRAAVHPGATAGDVDHAARRALAEAGYGDYFTHRTGHGLGLDGHEPPWIANGSQTVLEEGMVFSIEPGVYLPGRFGIRIEDIVAVSASGARLLTGFDHSLIVK